MGASAVEGHSRGSTGTGLFLALSAEGPLTDMDGMSEEGGGGQTSRTEEGDRAEAGEGYYGSRAGGGVGGQRASRDLNQRHVHTISEREEGIEVGAEGEGGDARSGMGDVGRGKTCCGWRLAQGSGAVKGVGKEGSAGGMYYLSPSVSIVASVLLLFPSIFFHLAWYRMVVLGKE